MSAVAYPPSEVVRPALGVVGRKFGNPSRPTTVNTPALVVGDWAAHPTGLVFKLEVDPDSGETTTFVEWAVSHVPTGYRPADISLAWYHAVRLAAELDKVWPKGTPDAVLHDKRKRDVNSAKFCAALAACQVEQSAETEVSA